MSNENTLAELSAAMADAVEKAGAATVLVNARRRFPATGIAFAADLILTADHVVERDEDISVILPDGSEVAAEIGGRDPGSDLAVLRLAEAKATPAMQAKDEARVGQLALAVGRPTTEGVQASLGIVSAIGRAARTHRGGLLESYIRTDAIPYPGFSGGPLIDAEGKVLGINTSGLGHGASLAIPAGLAWKIAAALAEHGSVKRGFLGIRSQPVEVPEGALDREQETGLLVVGIEDDSPAKTGGLLVGDILVGFEGRPIYDHDELLSYLTGEIVGNAAEVEVIRGGKRTTVKVTVAERQELSQDERSHRHGRHGGREMRSHRGRNR
jgi:S1-C subfamily serine protease